MLQSTPFSVDLLALFPLGLSDSIESPDAHVGVLSWHHKRTGAPELDETCLVNDAIKGALSPESLSFHHSGLLTFLQDVIEQEDERLWSSISADSSFIHDQLCLCFFQKCYQFCPVQIP